MQINVCAVDAEGRQIPGEKTTYAISGFVRSKGESDDCINRLTTQDGLLEGVWSYQR